MPGWHDATKKLQEAGKLQTVGIILEQHPARTQLFMQWKDMGWPVMVDPLNLLGLAAVPITLLIDENGIIRFRGDPENLEAFLAMQPEGPAKSATPATRPALDDLAASTNTPEAQRNYADALVLWGGTEKLDLAIETYTKALVAEPRHGPTHFRLGVAYRKRYDSSQRQAGDFHRAVEHWGIALDIDPNQYIWRRRIQQYGPRLEKPYPFYDWVETARGEITARGETPVPLPIEPRGAEIAKPSKQFASAPGIPEAPDPEGRIRRDEKGFIEVEVTTVPATIEPGETGRVHIVMRPNPSIKAHWNNEAEDLAFWIDPPPGWQVDQRLQNVTNPPELVSDEVRRVELEVQTPLDWSGSATLPAYALYYVCEDVRGSCLYRRQDIPVRLTAAP